MGPVIEACPVSGAPFLQGWPCRLFPLVSVPAFRGRSPQGMSLFGGLKRLRSFEEVAGSKTSRVGPAQRGGPVPGPGITPRPPEPAENP